MAKKAKQRIASIPTGSGQAGITRHNRWVSAAALKLGSARLFSEWARQTLDQEADKILSGLKK